MKLKALLGGGKSNSLWGNVKTWSCVIVYSQWTIEPCAWKSGWLVQKLDVLYQFTKSK